MQEFSLTAEAQLASLALSSIIHLLIRMVAGSRTIGSDSVFFSATLDGTLTAPTQADRMNPANRQGIIFII